MKNISNFYLKKIQFLVVKFSVYLNRRVFVTVFDDNSGIIFSNSPQKHILQVPI